MSGTEDTMGFFWNQHERKLQQTQTKLTPAVEHERTKQRPYIYLIEDKSNQYGKWISTEANEPS